MSVKCTDTAKRAAIYRKAAKLIDDGFCDRSCWAVKSAATGDIFGPCPECDEFVDVMLGGSDVTSMLPFGNTSDTIMEDRDIRILLLCFMAAITERP
jgi:hypothetical protein